MQHMSRIICEAKCTVVFINNWKCFMYRVIGLVENTVFLCIILICVWGLRINVKVKCFNIHAMHFSFLSCLFKRFIRLCDDCEHSKRDIAESNYVIHEVHCRRNIVLCEQCHEPVPRSDLETHVKDVHAPVNCELCGSAVERNSVEQHKVSCFSL